MSSAAKQSGKHVLLVSDVTDNGGVTMHMRGLAAYAMKNGWKLSVLLDDNPDGKLSATQ